MPIPKTKATATASTKTKNDAPPVDTSDEAAASTGKPDKTAYDAEQAKFKSEIDALQAKLVRSLPVTPNNLHSAHTRV